MQTNNPDVLHPTRGSLSHGERLDAIDRAEQTIRELFEVYGGRPILKKEVVDAVAFAEGCTQETAQSYVDALSSIHPLSPFVSHEVNRKAHLSIKDPQLLTEDADNVASQQDSKQPPKKDRPQRRKGGANA